MIISELPKIIYVFIYNVLFTLFIKTGTSDDMEHNLSTFMTEMNEASYILSNLTPRSLVLIDELGRGTSNIDGISLAFAIAETLLDSSAYTLFITHYSQITNLADMYPNVRNIHLKVALDYNYTNNSSNISNNSMVVTTTTNNMNNTNNTTSSSSSSSSMNMIRAKEHIKFIHQVGSGPSELKDGYGILMSELCGFPTGMIEQARVYQKIVRHLYPIYINHNDIDPSVGLVSNLLQHLLLLNNTSLDDDSLCQYLNTLRIKVSEKATNNILHYLNNFTTPTSTNNSTMSNMNTNNNMSNNTNTTNYTTNNNVSSVDIIVANTNIQHSDSNNKSNNNANNSSILASNTTAITTAVVVATTTTNNNNSNSNNNNNNDITPSIITSESFHNNNNNIQLSNTTTSTTHINECRTAVNLQPIISMTAVSLDFTYDNDINHS